MNKTIEIAQAYYPILNTDKRNILLKSGRNAGKSKFMAQMVSERFFKYNADILVTRSNYGDLEKSMFQEIIEVLGEMDLLQFIETRTRPLKLINKINGNIVWFEGIGGADKSRTRGFKPKKKLSLVIVDEMQQLPEKSNLDQARATFRRHYTSYAKLILAFNPEPQNSHWANEFYRVHSEDDETTFLCLHTSYLDITRFLNDADLEEIELERRINPDNYRHMYLGETNGLFGGVYSTFDRKRHLVNDEIVRDMIRQIGINQVLVGIDSATTRDKTAVIPILVLNSGQCIVVEYLYHDPIKYGALDDSRLVPIIDEFLEDVKTNYDLRAGHKPIHIIVDSANANLVIALKYKVQYKYRIWSYSQKNIIQMARIMQDVFSQNVAFILDEGKMRNYITGEYEKHHPLVTALESVVWDKSGKGFDPIVENDTTDALTYAMATYFKNPHNLTFPKRYKYYELPVKVKEKLGMNDEEENNG